MPTPEHQIEILLIEMTFKTNGQGISFLFCNRFLGILMYGIFLSSTASIFLDITDIRLFEIQ